MKLKLENNPRQALDIHLHMPSGAVLLITAPKPDQCWLFRVAVAKDLTLVAVPEFGGVNLSLQSSPSNPVLMPYECAAAVIFQAFQTHTKISIPRVRCLRAIQMLQTAVKHWRCGPEAKFPIHQHVSGHWPARS